MRKKIQAFLNLGLMLLSMMFLCQACFLTGEASDNFVEGCNNRFLRFKFDYHMGDNDFVGEIDVVGLYIFDKQDKFIELIAVEMENLGESEYEVEIDKDYQDCKIVAWGGLFENNNQIEYPSMNKGDSIALLTFKLKTESGDLAPTSLDPMFFGGQDLLTFPENEGTRQTLSFLRNNNLINLSIVTVDGENVDLKNEYEAKIYAPNGHYRSDNSVLEDDVLITYNSIVSDTAINVVAFNTLRFNEIHSEETRLVVSDRETGVPVLSDKDEEFVRLIDVLIKRKPSAEMPNQEYLDRESVWDITIVVAPEIKGTFLLVNILINGWIIPNDVDIPDFE